MIVTLTGRDSNIEEIVDRYNEEVEEGIIEPELVSLLDIDDFTMRGEILSYREGEKFEGVMRYNFIPGDVLEYVISSKVGVLKNEHDDIFHAVKIADLEGIDDYDSETKMAYISVIESFRRGVGRELIEELQDDMDIGGIIAVPYMNVIGFYDKLGFRETDWFMYRGEEPLMLWTP